MSPVGRRQSGAGVGAAVALGLLLAMASSAHALPPGQLPEASLKQDLAQVLGVPVSSVVAAKGYDLSRAGAVIGVVLGRYREGAQGWTFPALATYYPCAAGTCLSLLRLGQSVSRLAPLALIDLARPAVPVRTLSPLWNTPRIPEPEGPVGWPVLLVAGEVQRSERPPGPQGPSDRSEGERTEQSLVLISLRTPEAPATLHTHTLLEREPDSERAELAPRRIGRRVEGLSLGRQGEETVMQVIERDLDSRYSHCLRPEPVARRYRLLDGRFQESADPAARRDTHGCR